MNSQIIIFTDLDGTLLDHFSYSYAPAQPMLEKLRELEIPLIFNSSKTLKEICRLCKELNNVHPFVGENGAVVGVPPGYFAHSPNTGDMIVQQLGICRDRLSVFLSRMREQKGYCFKSFSDFSIAELAQLTGLSEEKAGLAKQRLASEPVQWLDSEEAFNAFKGDVNQAGLNLTRGGRFVHLSGNNDKAMGVRWLIDAYQKLTPDKAIFTVALGDSPNDKGMLEAVDMPVVIEPAHGNALTLCTPKKVIYPKRKGSEGWYRGMQEVFQVLEFGK